MNYKLRDYQQKAVEFFKERGIAFFHMACGAGKTLTSISCIDETPVLIVTLSSVKYQFKSEIEKFLGDKYKVHVLSGRNIKKIPPADIYIINPDILWSNRFILRDQKFKLGIFDESHFFKSPKAKRQKGAVLIAKSLPKKILMTATPLTVAPIDWFGQLQILKPETFGGGKNCKMNWYQFAVRYSGGKEGYFGFEAKGATNVEELKERLKNIVFEVTEEEVMKEAPPCNIIDWKVQLPRKYVKEYNKINKEFEEWLKEQDITPYEFYKKMSSEHLSRIAELRKIVSDVKTDYTIEFIKDTIPPDDKVVIFTWYQSSVDKLVEHYGDKCVTITGRDSQKKKEENRIKFIEDPNIKYAIVNIKAGGVGLNLQKGIHTVVFTFLPHNWSDFEQAYKRVWRPGQKNIVNVYKLLLDGTVDIKMNDVIYYKKEITNYE